MKTYVPRLAEIGHDWWLVDAAGLTLGRLATRVATHIRGKHKPTFTPFLDTGDHVIVVNAEKLVLTGSKLKDKMYRRYSGYPGGLKEVAAGDMLRKHPERLVESAVRGMLPKGPLGRKLFRKLKVYAGPTHPHEAQKPQALAISAARRGEDGSLSDKTIQNYGTGRRKTATARVYLRPGSGKIEVNHRAFDDYFVSEIQKMVIRQPLVITETADKFDIMIRIKGGGATGQAGAVRHGISRALIEQNPELRKKLKSAGFLTRDPREVERKKYGQPGARKRFQFSKR